ncbi:MAG: hypothetical protein AAF657_31040 [Acidobacteriota bacterium]
MPTSASRFSSRCSQARAAVHKRLTERGELSMADAVSGTVKPAK